MFDIKLEGIDAALKQFDSKKVITAARQAINRTADSTRTEASRLIREEYNIKPTFINKFLKVNKASGNALVAEIVGKAKGLSLIGFDAKQVGVVANKKGFRYNRKASRAGNLRQGGEVSAVIKLSEGHTIVPSKYGNKPFITRFKSGKVMVLERETKERKSIKARLGPGVAVLFGSAKRMARIQQYLLDHFKTEFKRLMDLKR